jgi:hypothetical protein
MASARVTALQLAEFKAKTGSVRRKPHGFETNVRDTIAQHMEKEPKARQ